MAEDGSPLLPGWEAQQDAEGHTYYMNSATGETSWERPTPMSRVIASAAASAPLKPGWIEATDDEGNVYYIHSATGDTTWQRPIAGEGDAPPGPAPPTGAASDLFPAPGAAG